jgi:hypothetical protein
MDALYSVLQIVNEGDKDGRKVRQTHIDDLSITGIKKILEQSWVLSEFTPNNQIHLNLRSSHGIIS